MQAYTQAKPAFGNSKLALTRASDSSSQTCELAWTRQNDKEPRADRVDRRRVVRAR
jgi:hypothetical protein